MFFFLSKIFWLMAQPVSVVLLLVVLGTVLIAFNRRRLALATLVTATLIIGLTAFTSLGYVLIQPLEDRFAAPREMPEVVSAIVILGGATQARPSTARQTVEMNEAGDRLTAALYLARQYPDADIVLSGGGGLFDAVEAEAVTMRRFFLLHGVEESRLLAEGDSRNTDENSAFTADLLDDRQHAIVLVTSAFHMPRSVGLFETEGIAVVPWPTDYRSSGREGFGIDLANPVNNLNVTTVALKEWIGLVAYYLTGRTSELLPSQMQP